MPEVPKINMAENRNEHGKPEKENSLPDDALKNVSGGMDKGKSGVGQYQEN